MDFHMRAILGSGVIIDIDESLGPSRINECSCYF